MRALCMLAWGCLLVALPGQARAEPCASDDTLSEAAAMLLLAGPPLDDGDVAAALRSAQSDLPSARALAVRPDDEGAVRRWLRRVRDAGDAPLACGEARSAEHRVVLAAPRGGWLEVRGRQVRARLADGFGDPYLVFRDAADRMGRQPLDPGALEARAELPADLVPPVTVQLMAKGSSGPRPVAIRRIGSEAPSPGAHAARGARGAGRDERSTARRLARLRETQGVSSSLRRNRLLRQAAADHARRVCRSRRVAHEISPGADPEARLAQQGVRARVVGEAVARARGRGASFDALTRSPEHRMTLTDRRFTDVGIGRAEDDRGHTCLVILLAAWPRYHPP